MDEPSLEKNSLLQLVKKNTTSTKDTCHVSHLGHGVGQSHTGPSVLLPYSLVPFLLSLLHQSPLVPSSSLAVSCISGKHNKYLEHF